MRKWQIVYFIVGFSGRQIYFVRKFWNAWRSLSSTFAVQGWFTGYVLFICQSTFHKTARGCCIVNNRLGQHSKTRGFCCNMIKIEYGIEWNLLEMQSAVLKVGERWQKIKSTARIMWKTFFPLPFFPVVLYNTDSGFWRVQPKILVGRKGTLCSEVIRFLFVGVLILGK